MAASTGCRGIARSKCRRCHNRSWGFRGNHAAAAIGVRRLRVAGDRMGVSARTAARSRCDRPRSGLASPFSPPLALIKLPLVARAFGAINDAVGAISAASRAGTSFRVRLSRRRHAAVRPEGARRGFHPGVSGAAGRAGHERADHAVVLLADPAAGGARHGVAAGAHARRRRRGRTVHRRQYLSRHGGSAIVHPALSGAADAQRIVSGDDRRHGRDRRHRAGALRHPAGAVDPGCGGAFRHRLGARRAGGDPDQPDHGAGDVGRAHRRRAGRSTRRSRVAFIDPRVAEPIPTSMRPAPWMRSSRAPPPGSNCCSTSSRC